MLQFINQEKKREKSTDALSVELYIRVRDSLSKRALDRTMDMRHQDPDVEPFSGLLIG